MKRNARILITIFFCLIANLSVFAYTPGPEIIRRCPKCNAHIIQHTSASGNTFGARFWTDAKMVAPMLPEHPLLVKCPECGTNFWLREAEKLGEQSWGDKKWPDAAEPLLPSEEDMLKLLSTKLSQDKELYLRQQAWWAANDAFRKDPKATLKFSEAQIKNLQAFLRLLDEKNDDQRIMKAEIFRELGRFDECLDLLSYSFGERHKETVALITKLAQNKDPIVGEIAVVRKPRK